jgi:hypothetical protein
MEPMMLVLPIQHPLILGPLILGHQTRSLIHSRANV